MTGLSPQVPRGEERDTTMRDLIAVVFKRKWMILGIVVGVSALVGWKVLTTPQTFSADARVMIKRQGSRASELDRTSKHLPWAEVVESEMQLLQSAPVFERAMEKLREPTDRHPEGIDMGVFRLAKSIRAEVMGESSVLAIEGTAETPGVAVAITNAVAEAYVEVHKQMFALPETGGLIRERLETTLDALQAAEQKRADIQKTIGVTEMGDEEQALIRMREQLRGVTVEGEREIARLQTELDDAQAFLDGNAATVPFLMNLGSVQGNALSSTLTRLRDQTSLLGAMRQKYTEQHPSVTEAALEVKRLEGLAREHVREIIAIKAHELRALTGELKAVTRELRFVEGRLSAMPDARQQLNVLEARIRGLEEQHQVLSEQVITSELLSKSFDDYGVVVVSRALRGEANIGADMVRLVLAPLLALLAALALAFYLDNMDHSVGSRDDLERHLEIPVLASFPDAGRVDTNEDDSARERRIPFGRSVGS